MTAITFAKRFAALLCAAVTAAAALKINIADPTLPDGISPFSDEAQSITARVGAQTEYAKALENREKTETDSDDSNDLPDSASASSEPPESADGSEKESAASDTDYGANNSANNNAINGTDYGTNNAYAPQTSLSEDGNVGQADSDSLDSDSAAEKKSKKSGGKSKSSYKKDDDSLDSRVDDSDVSRTDDEKTASDSETENAESESADSTSSKSRPDGTGENNPDPDEDNLLADDGNHEDVAGDTPTDGAPTDEAYFETSIVDGETVYDERFSFTITHLRADLSVKQTDVYLNGALVPTADEVLLSSDGGGENKIRIVVTYTDSEGRVISAYREYIVYLLAQSGEEETAAPEFKTDLVSQTRSDPALEFFAYVTDGAQNVKVTVYHKNKKLKSDDGNYSCTLDMGINSLRVKATYEYGGESFEFYEEYEIKLVAQTTAETAPSLSYSNVPSQVKGSLYTLDLAPVDYLGNKLYYSNLYVRLNGATVKYSWDGEYTSYLLNLSAGQNTLDIRVTDNEGRYTDYSYVIECLAAADGEVIGYASFEIDANVLGLGTLLDGVTIEIRQGESAATCILRALEEAGFAADGTGDPDDGYYLAALEKQGIAASAKIDDTLYVQLEADNDVHFTDSGSDDRLGEKQYTSASGWMISVNGHYTSYGTSDLHLLDGDAVRLRFTLAYGKDIGGYTGGGANYDVTY